MKYSYFFYFQMLKDKKIIHKTDGKNIHSRYRKELLNKLLAWTPLVLSTSHFVYICSCYCVICKTIQTSCFLRETSWFNTSICYIFFSRPRPFRWGDRQAAGENMQPAGPRHPAWLTSTVSRHWILSVQTQKRPCSLSHRLHPEMKIPE